jgi:predicted nucleic acid binding AN1-type Zn finger protein
MEVITINSNNIIEANKKINTITNKCSHSTCNTKLKLTDFNCRCSNRFCMKHRLPESHDCSYDFKKDKINLVKVVAEKVSKI